MRTGSPAPSSGPWRRRGAAGRNRRPSMRSTGYRRRPSASRWRTSWRARARRLAEDHPEWEGMSEDELLRKANRLEQQMYRHARDLEFEEAAKLRDEIERIRRVGLGLEDVAAG